LIGLLIVFEWQRGHPGAISLSTQLVGARLYWSFNPESFNDSQSVSAWTYAVDSRLNLSFAVPNLKASPHSIKLVVTLLVPGFFIKAINLQDKVGKIIASLSPTIVTAREPVSSPVSGASVNSEVMSVNLQEFCLMFELTPEFARPLSLGGKLSVQCEYLPDLSTAAEKPKRTNRKAESSVILSSNTATQFSRALVMRRISELEHEAQALKIAVNDFYASNSWNFRMPIRGRRSAR